MTILGVLVTVLQVVLASSQECPTWFVHKTNKCECGQPINTILQCSNVTKKIKLLDGFCLTYNNDTEHLGRCPVDYHNSWMYPLMYQSLMKRCVVLSIAQDCSIVTVNQDWDRPSSLTTKSVRNACHSL